MNDLIKIDESGKTTARELYEFLELHSSQFARWAKTNIEDNEFYSEGVDWWGFDIMSSGNQTKDYTLTIDFAKHLCMLSRSERGKQARNYFVEVEKRYKQSFELPQTFSQALMLAAKQAEQIEQQSKMLTEAKPKVEFFDAVADSKTAIPMADAAKVLDMGIGRNNLFKFLRLQKVLANDNKPYQEYIDRGYFRVIEQSWTTPKGDTEINIKTLVYQKGLDFIRRLYHKQEQKGA